MNLLCSRPSLSVPDADVLTADQEFGCPLGFMLMLAGPFLDCSHLRRRRAKSGIASALDDVSRRCLICRRCLTCDPRRPPCKQSHDADDLCLLKIPNRWKRIEISVSAPYVVGMIKILSAVPAQNSEGQRNPGISPSFRVLSSDRAFTQTAAWPASVASLTSIRRPFFTS